MKAIRKILLSIVFLVFISGVIVCDGLIDNISTSDVIVVLGNKVELDGSPSQRLKSRLDKAFELYENSVSSLVLVSGGIGKEKFDEAKVMKAYLVEKGVPSEQIFEDNQGYNSFKSAVNTKKFLTDKNLHSALVVTNYYHISRTRLAFKIAGVEEVNSSHANYFEVRDLYSIPREIVGFGYYFFWK